MELLARFHKAPPKRKFLYIAAMLVTAVGLVWLAVLIATEQGSGCYVF